MSPFLVMGVLGAVAGEGSTVAVDWMIPAGSLLGVR